MCPSRAPCPDQPNRGCGQPRAPFPVPGYPPGRAPVPGTGVRARRAEACPRRGNLDRPADPPGAPGFEVGGLPERLVAPGARRRCGSPFRRSGSRLPCRASGSNLTVPWRCRATSTWPGGSPEGGTGAAGAGGVAGHVDSRTGPTVFYRLREPRAGGPHRGHTGRRGPAAVRGRLEPELPQGRVPDRRRVRPHPGGELRLVTCAGAFHRARGSYRDNLVVFARLVGTDGRNQG